MRWSVRELKKKLETVDVMGSAPAATRDGTASTSEAAAPKPASTEGSSVIAESQEWENSDGKIITAAILTIEGDTVKFLMPNGTAVDYPINKLSEASQKKIADLTAKAE